MAKKKAAEKGAEFVCPSCKAEVKPTFGTITGISPQKCKCGKFLVTPIFVAASVLGAFFALWYGVFLLTGLILPLIVQILLIPFWAYFGYRLSKKVMFRFISAKDLKI